MQQEWSSTKRLSDSRDEIEDFNWLLQELITPTSQTSIPHMVESAHRKYRDTIALVPVGATCVLKPANSCCLRKAAVSLG
jgi:hypothetical protein